MFCIVWTCQKKLLSSSSNRFQTRAGLLSLGVSLNQCPSSSVTNASNIVPLPTQCQIVSSRDMLSANSTHASRSSASLATRRRTRSVSSALSTINFLPTPPYSPSVPSLPPFVYHIAHTQPPTKRKRNRPSNRSHSRAHLSGRPPRLRPRRRCLIASASPPSAAYGAFRRPWGPRGRWAGGALCCVSFPLTSANPMIPNLKCIGVWLSG